jgi:hypothetical protein
MNREVLGAALFYTGALSAITSIVFATKTCMGGDHRPLWGGGLAFVCYLAGTIFLTVRPTKWHFILFISPLLLVFSWHTGWALSFFIDHMVDGWPICGTLTGRELEPDGAGDGLVLIWSMASAVAWLGVGAAFSRMTK